ncbi:hypothetical protein [Nitratireductor sp. XY-223]|uniref:hypothetical protein n=1 Tax=Nitratireductor sp. XY-223 TaxID=2561926 RepID=UPI0010AADE4D|nr:hypothetical protein [Nitratireductor sp. XY-223]
MLLEEKIELIRDAIRDHQQVTGLCNQYPREFCPHALGTKNGKWNTLVWQFGGLSEKGLPPEGAWRCMELIDLDQIAQRPGVWHRGFVFGRGEQTCIDRMDTVVDGDHSAEVRETFGGRIRQRGLQPQRRRRL